MTKWWVCRPLARLVLGTASELALLSLVPSATYRCTSMTAEESSWRCVNAVLELSHGSDRLGLNALITGAMTADDLKATLREILIHGQLASSFARLGFEGFRVRGFLRALRVLWFWGCRALGVSGGVGF